jgi:hypothetical protein
MSGPPGRQGRRRCRRPAENQLMAVNPPGYGLRVGIFTVMVRRVRLGAVASGVGLAPAR